MKKIFSVVIVQIFVASLACADTITINWDYGDGGATTNTCTVGGVVDLPNVPQRPGYRLTGWQLVPQCSFVGFDTTINAVLDYEHTRWKPINGDNGHTMATDENIGVENSADLNNGEFAVTFNHGTIKGSGVCSSVAGTTMGEYGEPSNGNGQYCWCHAATYTPNGDSKCSISVDEWVYYREFVSKCDDYCSRGCAYRLGDNIDFRQSVLKLQHCGIVRLDTSIDTILDYEHTRWKPINGDDGYTMSKDKNIGKQENSADLNNGEFALTFDYGVIKGTGACSTSEGTTLGEILGNPNDAEGDYCWCHATSYTPVGYNQCDIASADWAFYRKFDNRDYCKSYCPRACAYRGQDTASFRQSLFGQSNN